MSKLKAIGCICLTVCLLVACFPFTVSASPIEAEPSVSAQSAILIEAASGETVMAKNADFPLPMASTTKIMTALVALELASPETEITVDPAAVGIEGSSVYLTENEVLTLEQLLYALLLESANDAATAIAIGLSGSVEAFADEMNRAAGRMGLCQTHFTNPHGLDDAEHFTTAKELAQIAREALQHELLRTIVSTRKITVPRGDGSNGVRLLINHNKLLRLYDGCIGMKTGFTKKSGRCLVSAAERDGVLLIAVTLHAPNDWDDHTRMLDYGFSRYTSVLLCQSEELLLPISVVGGTDSYVMVSNPSALRLTLPAEHGTISKTLELPRFVYATVRNGEILGKAVYRCDTNGDGTREIIGEVSLIACYSVKQNHPKKSFWQWLWGFFQRFK
ncbi:MAG: D-alanyl-D-alanine carboxypeptidase [Clostridia bacterium]|nr:D-alanyl-D-alanine carboxypeptidase [Clostridia bacterium]